MRRAVILAVAASLALAGRASAQAPSPSPAKGPAPWKALVDTVEAARIVLRDVCLPGILDGRPIDQLADYSRLVRMPPRSVQAGPADRVWRLGSLAHVNAVAWADGSCSAYVDTGPATDLRRMAEEVILARPEGFARGRSDVVDNGRVERTVFCAQRGEERLVATITSPAGTTRRGTRALSSTVYRARGASPLCDAAS